MTTTCALDELLDPDELDEPLDDAPDETALEEPPAAEPPVPPPDPPDPPELPELPAPETSCPTDKLTDATTPAIGDVRLASASDCLVEKLK